MGGNRSRPVNRDRERQREGGENEIKCFRSSGAYSASSCRPSLKRSVNMAFQHLVREREIL